MSIHICIPRSINFNLKSQSTSERDTVKYVIWYDNSPNFFYVCGAPNHQTIETDMVCSPMYKGKPKVVSCSKVQ